MAQLTTAQIAALKAFILADPTLGPLATSGDYQGVANGLNADASPDYWAWRLTISRAAIYNATGPGGTTWNWATYKSQQIPEQNAWVQMFMGDEGLPANVNWRAGVHSIFSGSGAQIAQRDHIWACARRKVNVAEKVLAVAVSNPPANSGNNSAAARGSVTNPDNLGFEGTFQPSDIGAILT